MANNLLLASLKMVVDREQELQSFVPVESWTLKAQLNKQKNQAVQSKLFTGVLHAVKRQKDSLSILNEDDARGYEAELKGAAYSVSKVRKQEVRQRPSAPFTTSTLQQEAGRKLGLTPRRTMLLAQELYEGLPLGGGESVGLITYPLTDSVDVATSAVSEARGYITEIYSKNYVPKKRQWFAFKAKAVQEAYEAIRPTSIRRTPDSVKPLLSRAQFNLYSLIWSRMLASQLADASSEATTVDVEAACKSSSNVYIFQSTGLMLKFPGFQTLYMVSRDDDESDDGLQSLPSMTARDRLACQDLEALQRFTQPPPRYTEPSLIKAMEEKGIGRPSTYAPTVGTLLDFDYVTKKQNRLFPTPFGITVADTGVTSRAKFMGMETDGVCDTCGKPMVIKTGRFGRFLACTGFPECRQTKPILNKIGVSCPKPDCGGEIVEHRARGGRRPFYSCSLYPNCTFMSDEMPR